jgi:DNA-binding transcriptional ArsR family regulator
MGATKSDEFSVKDNRVARYAKALAHPARIAILQYLAKQQSCVCGDIVEELPLSQSTVSQHLKELKDAGLIKLERPRWKHISFVQDIGHDVSEKSQRT